MIEAALVFPLVILITAGIILTGLKMYGHVSEDAAKHRSLASEKPGITSEDILRGKWILSQGNGSDTAETEGQGSIHEEEE